MCKSKLERLTDKDHFGAGMSAAYWLDCSPVEWTDGDAKNLAQYARRAIEHIKDDEAEIKRLREALAFYADEETYTDDRQYTSTGVSVHTGYTKIQGDYGAIARKALEGTE